MSRKPLISMASFNPNPAGNINRMTVLMSISEITPHIFISGQMAATLEQVQKLGITYILNVAVESSAIVYPKHIKLDKYDIIDFPTAPISNYFNTLTDKIHAHLTANKQNKVLVHCMAGISRSTTIVCAYLVRYMNMSLRDAYLLCKRHRPICFPNLGFWNQLISYEYQIRKENSVRMIPTQFGQVPDVAFEELRQIRGQTQQQPTSLPFFAPTFVSNNMTPSINASSTNDSLFLSSNPARPTARDVAVNPSTNTIRSRSLANGNANTPNRSSVLAASTNVSNPSYQTPIFATNKQTFATPTRFGIGRINPPPSLPTTINTLNTSLPSGSSSSSYITRNLPISTSPNIRSRVNPQSTSISSILPNQTTNSSSTNNPIPRSHYETTYRSSFIKPLVP